MTPVDENKVAIKIYEEMSNKITYLSGLENNGSGYYDNSYIKIKFDLDDNLPLKKELDMHSIVRISSDKYF